MSIWCLISDILRVHSGDSLSNYLDLFSHNKRDKNQMSFKYVEYSPGLEAKVFFGGG